ncbi:PP2C family protein-serine/threonine phosphatase [Parendozoicomonas sp. Alg238-R29]|uniref:PP2C family serine/threonine-protein phosphatase n=1 Tax=Parendozoicomonas sp. Alg238-R29 TaxID=2993446 RepID=UPI00248E1AE5|nr:PP2C family protein-serine/threonine phosphatase [Parendozoicomonas sp. Alg238-R29]
MQASAHKPSTPKHMPLIRVVPVATSESVESAKQGHRTVKVSHQSPRSVHEDGGHRATGVRSSCQFEVRVYKTPDKVRYSAHEREELKDDAYPQLKCFQCKSIGIREIPVTHDNLDKTKLLNDEYWLELDAGAVERKRKKQIELAQKQQNGSQQKVKNNWFHQNFQAQLDAFISTGYSPDSIQRSDIESADWGSECLWPAATAKAQGGKKVQQDYTGNTAFDVFTPDGHLPYQAYFVLDGHGEEAERFVCLALPMLKEKINADLNSFSEKLYLDVAENCALKKSFVDTSVCIKNLGLAFSGMWCGSTVCTMLIRGRKLVVANLGDTRAIASDSAGKTVQLTVDAKPEDSVFGSSIYKRGGKVIQDGSGNAYRVGNMLAPARSLGCGIVTGVSARPKISEYNLGDEEETLVIASDGVWDIASSDQVGKLASGMRKVGASPKEVANAIISLCLKAATEANKIIMPPITSFPDNMSVVVVFADENEHLETTV